MLEEALLNVDPSNRELVDDGCLHALFELQAARAPDSIAAVHEDKHLTFYTLNRRSNQLAHYLRGLQIHAGRVVALCMRSSLESAIAMLGIHKAGGACLLLDPHDPLTRREFILKDGGVDVLLTDGDVPSSEFMPCLVVSLTHEANSIAEECTSDLQGGVTASCPAFVMYTSGSTGVPKGVVHSHRSAGYALMPDTSPGGLTSADVFLIAGYGMLPDLYWPWFVGARAVIATERAHRDPKELVKLCAEQQITFACMGPSLLQEILMVPEVESCTSLREVAIGGELPSAALQRSFARRLTARLRNIYGLTETNSAVTYLCGSEMGSGSIPAGKPCPNVQVHIMDRLLRPVPVGESGCLYISTPALTQGYLNRPDLTAERLVPDPYNPGKRLLDTGDVARYLPDGNIEILGREDQQVKLRGFRIELGEIEVSLQGHDNVSKAAVLLRNDGLGERLVGYVVPVPGTRPTPLELRRFLSTKLPEYMVPSQILMLDAMPSTRNGKVDRAALPAPNSVVRCVDNDFVSPQSECEQCISLIWEAVLGSPRIGIHDNFFDLGGHSLLAAEIVARVNAAFGCDVPVQSLFDGPTISELASLCQNRDITTAPGEASVGVD